MRVTASGISTRSSAGIAGPNAVKAPAFFLREEEEEEEEEALIRDNSNYLAFISSLIGWSFGRPSGMAASTWGRRTEVEPSVMAV